MSRREKYEIVNEVMVNKLIEQQKAHNSFVRELIDGIPETAKIIVGSIHDETLDLSTLKCTGNDFTKWS